MRVKQAFFCLLVGLLAGVFIGANLDRVFQFEEKQEPSEAYKKFIRDGRERSMGDIDMWTDDFQHVYIRKTSRWVGEAKYIEYFKISENGLVLTRGAVNLSEGSNYHNKWIVDDRLSDKQSSIGYIMKDGTSILLFPRSHILAKDLQKSLARFLTENRLN